MRLQIIDPNVNYKCSGCGWCCDQPWATTISPEDAQRYAAVDWSPEFPQLNGRQLYRTISRDGKTAYELAKSIGNRCIFLADDNRCIVHAKLGFQAKPHMCKQFPYLPVKTADGQRVSANYGCKAVQERIGPPLRELSDDIRHTIAEPNGEIDKSATIPLTNSVRVPLRTGFALLERIAKCFAPLPGDEAVTIRLGRALHFLRQATQCAPEELAGAIDSDRLAAGFNPADVAPFESPATAPMPSRMLFAATLYPDIADPDAPPGWFKRFSLVPRLLNLTNLRGAYASRLLARNINVAAAFGPDALAPLSADANALLRRYLASRLWQHFPAGTKLPIVSGVHQHALDLCAVIFYANVLRREAGGRELDFINVQRGLNVVEFHLANQQRLHQQVLQQWFAGVLANADLATATLRLIRCGAPVGVAL